MLFKANFWVVLFTLASFFSQAQKFYELEMNLNDPPEIVNRKFYIHKVVDKRTSTFKVGTVQTGLLNHKRPAKFQNGLATDIEYYLETTLPNEMDMVPLSLIIEELEISEKTNFTSEYAVAHIKASFYFEDRLIYSCEGKTQRSAMDVTMYHEDNIRVLLQNCMNEMQSSRAFKEIWASYSPGPYVVNDEREKQNTDTETPLSNDKVLQPQFYKNRNIVAIGYQIGGWNLIGINYELRATDYLGIHFGVGFIGYTTGLKFHFGKEKNSPFINLSYKDGGFGLLSTLGAEYGARIPLSPNQDGFALHLQVGIASIIDIDPIFEATLYNGNPAPPVMLSIGGGFSF